MSQYATDTAEMFDPFLRKVLNSIPDPKETRSTDEDSENEASNAELRSIGLTKPITSLYSTCGPRSTVQPLGPGRSIQPTPPTTSVGPMASLDDSMLLPQVPSHPSQPTPEPGPCQSAPRFNVSETRASYEHQFPENARLRPTGSHLAIDAAGGSPVPTSTAARSHSQPSVASLEAHFHPPHAAISPQDAQEIQNTSAHIPDMHSYLGTPPSENAAPPWQERPFQTHKEIAFMALPGSDDPISVRIDTQGSSEAQARRDRNAESSRRHREKKRKRQADLSEDVGQLRMEMKGMEERMWRMEMMGMEERMWRMEKEQNLFREFIRNLFEQVPWLGHSIQTPNFLSQTSNTVERMNDFVARPQSYGRGGSSGEQPSKRRQANHVPEFSTPAYRDFVNQPTGIRSELPPKQNLQDTSTRWDMSQSAGVSTPSTMVASLR